ncbi:hypothetical protein BDZ89DRAFT_1057594 [Hymenopellis radicata]|nr:hypothetical protein BDZ89DRAFT_1057594 [Hymenopellis radicata]
MALKIMLSRLANHEILSSNASFNPASINDFRENNRKAFGNAVEQMVTGSTNLLSRRLPPIIDINASISPNMHNTNSSRLLSLLSLPKRLRLRVNLALSNAAASTSLLSM